MSAYRNIRSPRFRCAVIKDKAEIYKALRTFFSAPEGGTAP